MLLTVLAESFSAVPSAPISATILADGVTLRLAISKPVSGTAALGFSRSSGSITSGTIDGLNIDFVVPKVYSGESAGTLSYDKAIGDLHGSGGEVASFSGLPISNASQQVIPLFSSLVLGSDGVSLVGTLNTNISSPGNDYKLGFSAKSNGSAVTISSAARSPNNVITFTLAAKSYQGDTIQLSYNSTTGDIESEVGANELASFTDAAVTNNAAAWTPNELYSADTSRRVAWFIPGTFYEDSAKTTPATDTGDVVGAWVDQRGNWDVIQGTTGNKPILQADGGILVGGSSLRNLRKQGISPTFSQTEKKVLGVRAKPTNGATGNTNMVWFATNAGGQLEFAGFSSAGTTARYRVRNGTILPHATTTALNQKHSLILHQSSDSAAKAYVNGVEETVSVGTGTSTAEWLYIGGNASSGMDAVVYAACAVVGGSALSAGELARLDAWLDGF